MIVTLITRYFFSKKDNKEYAQKISTVNREVVYALRPGISEGHIPELDVLNSLINATARKYRVEKSDVYHAKQIAEELIKEIMDSSFISSETKKSYCSSLSHLVDDEKSDGAEHAEVIERKVIASELRQKQTEWMSLTLGVIAAILTMVGPLTTLIEKSSLAISLKPLLEAAFPTLAVLSSVLIATISMIFGLTLKRVRQNSDHRNSET
nr:hypothetical protein [Vibrio sp. V23_P3S9T160]